MFEKAKWIWRKEEAKADEHVDFLDSFNADNSGKLFAKEKTALR